MTRVCNRCHEERDIDEFHHAVRYKDGINVYCRICTNSWTRQSKASKRSRGLCLCGKPMDSGLLTCQACIEKGKDRVRHFFEIGKCRCGNTPVEGRKQCSKCIIKDRTSGRNLRQEILKEYGGKCACPGGCDVSDPKFLSVDHINGDGVIHRKVNGDHSGRWIYRWLKKNGFPKDNFRLLCHNCNSARGFYGSCPHEDARL